MPIDLEIIRAREFIRLGARGRIDLKASKLVLAELAGACRKRGINQAMLDLRALPAPGPKPVFSEQDLVSLVNTFHEIGFTKRQRLAVLYHSDPHRRAPMLTFIAKQRGWNVQAFKNFEDALIWLSHADEPKAEMADTLGKQKVPVHNLKSLKTSATARQAPQPAIRIKSDGGSKGEAVQPGAGKKQPGPARTLLATRKDMSSR